MCDAKEYIQSAVSYCTACAGSTISVSLEETAGKAEQITLIVVCGIVVVRLAYDITKLIKLIKTKKKQKQVEEE